VKLAAAGGGSSVDKTAAAKSSEDKAAADSSVDKTTAAKSSEDKAAAAEVLLAAAAESFLDKATAAESPVDKTAAAENSVDKTAAAESSPDKAVGGEKSSLEKAAACQSSPDKAAGVNSPAKANTQQQATVRVKTVELAQLAKLSRERSTSDCRQSAEVNSQSGDGDKAAQPAEGDPKQQQSQSRETPDRKQLATHKDCVGSGDVSEKGDSKGPSSASDVVDATVVAAGEEDDVTVESDIITVVTEG